MLLCLWTAGRVTRSCSQVDRKRRNRGLLTLCLRNSGERKEEKGKAQKKTVPKQRLTKIRKKSQNNKENQRETQQEPIYFVHSSLGATTACLEGGQGWDLHDIGRTYFCWWHIFYLRPAIFPPCEHSI